MDPLFAVMAIRAAIRIGRTAADAFEQYAQERPILLPDAERAGQDALAYIRDMADRNEDFRTLLERDEELSKLWDDGFPTPVAGAEAAVFAVACRFAARGMAPHDHLGARPQEEVAGGAMIGQWAKGKGPVTPWARVLVAMTDVALEYVAARPDVVGIGGNGEKLIGALAAAFAEAIPDGGSRDVLGPGDRFAERLAALVLQSGLKAIGERSDLLLSEPHLRVLLGNVLKPVVAALPDTVAEQIAWRDLADALIGPATSAAVQALAADPSLFLGQRFAADRAAGVLTVALLKAAQRQGARGSLSREGLYALFQAATVVAVEHPALVLGAALDRDLSDPADRSAAEAVAVNLFASIADRLRRQAPPFDGEVGIALATAVIEGLKQSTPALAKAAGSWEAAVDRVLAQLLDGLAEGLPSGGRPLQDTAFSHAGLIGLARVFIDQVAQTPHLVTGTGAPELQRVVGTIAVAMAGDENLLLTAEDWRRIAAVAAQEAALNPGRLFGLNATNPDGMLAARMIGSLLDAAAADLAGGGRPAGPVLVGETLREAVILLLRGSAGNPEKAAAAEASVAMLAGAVNGAVGRSALSLGGKEWSRLFRLLLPAVIATAEVPALDEAKVAALLGQH